MTQKETFKQQIISDYRITLPPVPRNILGLKVGDLIKVTIEKAEGA
jgi:bifunctional DNA-binding transcriptional regulator/antitoxin component of YhaV-PrlF toxin-antitoxin module